MTCMSETVTLERSAFDKWYAENLALWGNPRDVFWQCWQAAIAHLSRAAEPVAEVKQNATGWSYVNWMRGRCVVDFVGALLYTRPNADARAITDAMVERGLQAAQRASDARLPRYKTVRAILEAALVKENGNESD